MKVIQPIRYPGGKSRVVKKYIKPAIPNYSGNFFETFIGAGSISLYEARCCPKKTIHINDLNYKLYCLWCQIKENSNALIKELHAVRDLYNDKDFSRSKAMSADMKTRGESKDPFDIAVSYFVLNKISFSGLENASVSQHNYRHLFNHKNINKLMVISTAMHNIKIFNKHYKDIFTMIKADDYTFLDPPYEIDDFLYGKDGKLHKGFDHDEFAKLTIALPCKWLLTYNDNESIRERFKDFHIYDKSYTYCMAFASDDAGNLHGRERNELIIANYEVRAYKDNSLDKFFT